MIGFARHTCLKHITISMTSFPEEFEDVSSLPNAQEVSEDEYMQLNLTGNYENRGKFTYS